MSIPVGFHVLGPGMIIHRNLSFGTVSYGTDMRERNVWLNYLRRGVRSLLNDKSIEFFRQRDHSWLDTDFEGFAIVNGGGHFFLRSEILDYKFDESVVRRNEFKDGPVILEDEKEEEKRVKKVNKKNYLRLKNDPMSGANDTEKWIDPID